MQSQLQTFYGEEREMMPLGISEGIAISPWIPLGRGFLTKKYERLEANSSPVGPPRVPG
jgi:aryl-alcohol dehydrogenase-like predicted oxidoreductase